MQIRSALTATGTAAFPLAIALTLAACGGGDDAAPSTTVAPAPSEESLPVVVDLGGAPPSDPLTADLAARAEEFWADQEIPTDPAGILAAHAADRGVHLLIENAAMLRISTDWITTAGGGEVRSQVDYVLDEAGLDVPTVVDTIADALVDAGLGEAERDASTRAGNDVEILRVDGLEVVVAGVVADSIDDVDGFRIEAWSTTPDVAPVMFGPTARIRDEFDELTDPSLPLFRSAADTDYQYDNSGAVMRVRLERLVSDDPAETSRITDELADRVGADVSTSTFQTGSDAWLSIDEVDEGVTVELWEGVIAG